MKTIKFCAVALVALLFASCNKGNEIENPLNVPNQAKFNATAGNFAPRMTGTTWDAGDAIGIFALNAGQSLTTANIYDSKQNIRFTTSGNGQFTVGTQSEAIVFPNSGNLDFIAYYPFSSSVSNFTLPINVTDQSSQSAIDVLYSNNAKGFNTANNNVNLNFQRAMAQLVLSVAVGDGITSLNGLKIEVDGMIVEGALNLANGSIELGSATGNFETVTTVAPNNLSATSTSIFLPTQSLATATIRFTLGTQVFNWTPTAQPTESGMKYSYNFELSTTGAYSLLPGSNISDWTPGNTPGGNNVLAPSTFTVDATTVSLANIAGATGNVTLTALATQAWTAASNQTWLTVTPASGTGGETLALTATENTGAERSAIVTITPTGPTTLTPLTVIVTQAAAAPAGPALLFPGSNFDDWAAFLGSLSGNLNGLATQSINGGMNASGALHLNGTPAANTAVFWVFAPAGIDFTGKTAISFYVNGTSANRTINVTFPSATSGTYAFNIGSIGSTDITATPITGANSFTGSINTAGGWTKITLDISTIAGDLVTDPTAAFMTFRAGGAAGVSYDLMVDNFTIE
jgi:hypothetical protein